MIPATDELIITLDQIRYRVPTDCQLAIAESSSLSISTDKQQTIELAERLEIKAPKGD